MLERLRKLNPDIDFYSVKDSEFKRYGCVLNFNTDEIIKACNEINMPEEGSRYSLSVKELEDLKCAKPLKGKLFGGCEAQIGLCHGYNTNLNALEFHNSSEINIAVTPLVLLLGFRYDMESNEYSSDKIKAFYLEKGDAVEVYATSMHFCPCQVSIEGFSCVVVLPKNTNDVLDELSEDRLLFKENKWIICHDQNKALIDKGVYPGIHGINYNIKY